MRKYTLKNTPFNLRGVFNKKAESSFENANTLVFTAVIMFAVTLIVFTFVFLLHSYESGLTAVPGKFRAEMVGLRFTNSQECFAYQDQITKRVFPGVIDVLKFNEMQLAVCYKTDEITGKDHLNFRLQLESNLDYSVKSNKYFNVDTFTITKNVVVKDGDLFRADNLFIYV